MNSQKTQEKHYLDKSCYGMILKPEIFKKYIDEFNQKDNSHDNYFINNADAFGWLSENIPYFEASDRELETMYYFSWWVFRKYIKDTADGFVLADSPIIHNFYEGRWLRDRKYLKGYAGYLCKKKDCSHSYTPGTAEALDAWSKVSHDLEPSSFELFQDIVDAFRKHEEEWLDKDGLFRSRGEDGFGNASSNNDVFSPAVNSCMYGDSLAVAAIAEFRWDDEMAKEFRARAEKIKKLVEWNLWDDTADFYKTMPCVEPDERMIADSYHNTLWWLRQNQPWADKRELSGYVPWRYGLPAEGKEKAWGQLKDISNLYAGKSSTDEEGDCRFMTSHTLAAMVNLLNHYKQAYVTKKDFYELLQLFAAESGCSGNYVSVNDLIITGLVGLRPSMDNTIELNPLLPEDGMEYFCLDGLRYHDCNLTILWDRTGEKYKKGKGLRIYADGYEIASSQGLQWISVDLPNTRAGWMKSRSNPVIGANRPTAGVGAMFDVEVLPDNGIYRMYGSWRFEQSIALLESADGESWSKPVTVLAPNPDTDWEKDISRPTIVKRDGLYHMWYTAWPSNMDSQGQEGWYSCIGYATSRDGVKWERRSSKPVLRADRKWEGVVIMCPNVIWDENDGIYKMWYSAGFKGIEPNVIGYATSPDGMNWNKYGTDPIFVPDANYLWEQEKVAGCQVIKWGEWYYMAYIGWRDTVHAQIGLARSRDGITGWERHPENPIIRPGRGAWDQDACYKPLMRFDGQKWLLWYNGRHRDLERMGLAIHEGGDLEFDNRNLKKG